jgi:hypothetical protein
MRLIVLLISQKDYEHFNQVPVEIGKIEVAEAGSALRLVSEAGSSLRSVYYLTVGRRRASSFALRGFRLR